MHFKDREHAGQQLAVALQNYKGPETIVYALPRGGVVLGVLIAKKLGAKFDLLIPRKIGHPYDPEYAVAAIAGSGEIVKNETEVIQGPNRWLKSEAAKQLREINRRRRLYLKGRKPLSPGAKTAIIVDDGLATGLTMKAAISEIRNRGAKAIVVAVPVSPADSAKQIADLVDELVVLHVPAGFGAIGAYYLDFPQLSDEEVVSLIDNYDKQTSRLAKG